jgi:hypothetical protein
MKRGFYFISKNEIVLEYLIQIEQDLNFDFPKRFKEFVSNHSFSSDAIVLDMVKDEMRGFEFPAEDPNPLYFKYFRDLGDIADELKSIDQDELWQSKGLIVIGYSTVGEKICLGVKEDCFDEIWRVDDDSIPENKYRFLASDIFEFVQGLISKRTTT